MESFEIVLLLLGCVLVSSIFDQVFSRLAMPLVQIALGAVVGFLIAEDPSAVISDPELFLLIFIAPLLFDESRHADKGALWKNKGHIISLAIGLVFITALVVGFVLNLIVPSIPLVAAFALGAALGPTDAAAVAAMGKDVKLTDRQKSLLSGEALFNDASGVVGIRIRHRGGRHGNVLVVQRNGHFSVRLRWRRGRGPCARCNRDVRAWSRARARS